MVSRILSGLLALVLLQASLTVAGAAIPFNASAGGKHAERELSSNSECILENDRIDCVRARR